MVLSCGSLSSIRVSTYSVRFAQCTAVLKKSIWHKELVTSLVAKQFVKLWKWSPVTSSLQHKQFSQRDLGFGSRFKMGKRAIWVFNKLRAITSCDTSKWPPSHVSLTPLQGFDRELPQAYHSCHLWCIMPCALVSDSPLRALLRVFLSLAFFFGFLSSECCRRKHKDHLLSTGC